MPDAPSEFRYKRVLLKVSGEVLMGDQAYGIDMKTVAEVAQAVAEVAREGVEICLVIGGGNIFRGLSKAAGDMDRASADYMGMLATVMNALAMQTERSLEGLGRPVDLDDAARLLDHQHVVALAVEEGCPLQQPWVRGAQNRHV